MIAAVTGHRPQQLAQEWDHDGPYSQRVVAAYRAAIRQLGVRHLIVGGALGVDTLAARAAFLEGVPYYVAVPFKGQEARWTRTAQERYRTMLEHAASVHIVSEGGYSPDKMQVRNRFMVERADALIAWWNGSPGGTRNCIGYALERGVPVHQVGPGPHIPDSAAQLG